MPYENKPHIPKAVLVGLQLPQVSDADHAASLTELGRLAQTLGFDVIATISQRRKSAVAGTVIGEGKLQELAELTGGKGDAADADSNEKVLADKVIFDDELTPTQLKNLETATGVEVLDRNGVIIEIFHRHAKTREARLQVEIARLRYLSPRLRLNRAGADRQGGGIGAKGIGETAHELDKRRIRDRIAELKRELNSIHDAQVERRQRRAEQLKVALVGYTNAGKSSLMRALTGSAVLVEDKLFATLDTTVRAIHPTTQPRILVSDTVGFIKKLPHDLVASFRSTLDEAADASLLLYVVDVSDPTFRSQLEVTRTVLGELKLQETASLLILNKIDLLPPGALEPILQEFPGAIALSSKNEASVAGLRMAIVKHFELGMVDVDLTIPFTQGKLLGELHSVARILGETHNETSTTFRIRSFPEMIARLKSKLLTETEADG